MSKNRESPHAPEVPDQPAGTPDRTQPPNEAFERDVDEGDGRHQEPEGSSPVGGAGKTTPDGSVVKPGKEK
jgi:hypothetical protein